MQNLMCMIASQTLKFTDIWVALDSPLLILIIFKFHKFSVTLFFLKGYTGIQCLLYDYHDSQLQ